MPTSVLQRFTPEHTALILTRAAMILLPLCYLPGLTDPAGIPRFLLVQVWALAVTLCFCVSRRTAARARVPWATFAMWLVFAGVSLIWAHDRLSAGWKLAKLVTLVQAMPLAAWLWSIPGARDPLLRTALWSTVPVSLIGLAQYAGLDVPPFVQLFPPSSTFLNRNLAAQFLTGVLPIGCIHLLCGEKRTMPLRLAMVLPGVGYLFATGTRAAWIAIGLASAIAFASYVFRARRGTDNGYLLRGILLAGTLLLFGLGIMATKGTAHTDTPLRKLLSFANPSENRDGQVNTVSVRASLYANSMKMVVDKPLTGVGLGQFPVHYPRYHDAVMDTATYALHVAPERLHNDLLETLVELGLPGFLCLCLLVGLAMFGYLNGISRSEGDSWRQCLGAATALCALLIDSLFSFPLAMPVSGWLFWFWMGCGVSSREPAAAEKEHHPKPRIARRLAQLIPLIALQAILIGLYIQAGWASKLLAAGNDLERQGRIAEAAAFMEAAHARFPADIKALDRWVTLAVNQDPDRGHAVAVAQAFSRRRPYSGNGLFRLAIALKDAGHADAAQTALAGAERYGGVSEKTRLLAGMLAERAGRIDQARACYEQALALAPHYRPAGDALQRLRNQE